MQLEEQQKQEQAMAAQRGPCPTCQAAEQQVAELEKLQAKVEELQDGIAAARTAADAQLARAAADAQAQQQVRVSRARFLRFSVCATCCSMHLPTKCRVCLDKRPAPNLPPFRHCKPS